MLDIKFSNHAARFLKHCENEIYERLIKKVKNLAENPFPSDAKRLINEKEKVFRVRVGDLRILYVIFNESKTLLISDIDKRSRVYKR
jgi:mRNA interferase RelE/StbE